MKNDWKKAGSAGRKTDNKLWDKFNKSADRFFTAKKEVVDEEINTAKTLLSSLNKDELSINEIENQSRELKNISKSNELNKLRDAIKSKRNSIKVEQKNSKIKAYINLFDAYTKNELEDESLPNQIVSKIKNLDIKKSNTDKLAYACIKLEIMAGNDSLKKDASLRNKIQLEMLTEKFNKSDKTLSSLDSLVIHFLSNLSKKPTASDKTLWKRVSKSIEEIL